MSASSVRPWAMKVPRYSYSNGWCAQSRKPRRRVWLERRKGGRDSSRLDSSRLGGCVEAFKWAVGEEDLHRDVGLDCVASLQILPPRKRSQGTQPGSNQRGGGARPRCTHRGRQGTHGGL